LKRTLFYILLLFFSVLANAQKQWVSFYIHPVNTIFVIDGERHTISDGFIELLLPLGNHTYSVESPFFESYSDTFNLKDDARRDISVVLQSEYGYLNLRSSGLKDMFYIDQHEVGRHYVQSIRYRAGIHRLTVLRDTLCICDYGISLTAGEKSIVDIDSLGVTPFPWDPARWLVSVDAIGPNGELLDSTAMADAHALMSVDSANVNVTSNVDGADIFIDNRLAGTTPMVIPNLVANRYYLVTLRKQGFKPASQTVLISPEGLTEAYIKMKKK